MLKPLQRSTASRKVKLVGGEGGVKPTPETIRFEKSSNAEYIVTA